MESIPIPFLFNLFMKVSIVSIFLSFILGIFSLQNKKGVYVRNLLLGIFFTSFGIMLLSHFALGYELPFTWSLVAIVGTQFELLIVPSYYLYLKTFFNFKSPFTKSDIIHLTPFIVSSLITILYWTINQHAWSFNPYLLYTGMLLTQAVLYFVLAFIKLDLFSLFFRVTIIQMDKLVIYWLRFFTLFVLFVFLLRVVSLLVYLGVFYHPNWCTLTASLISLNVFFYLTVITYLGLKLPALFTNYIKYQKSSIPESFKTNYENKLLSCIKTERPYLDPNLTLAGLAKKVGITQHYLSQILNDSFQSNYFDFINMHRIKHSKKLLTENNGKKINILEIAYSSGFNSKTTFNTCFKKITGTTPSDYRKNFILEKR